MIDRRSALISSLSFAVISGRAKACIPPPPLPPGVNEAQMEATRELDQQFPSSTEARALVEHFFAALTARDTKAALTACTAECAIVEFGPAVPIAHWIESLQPEVGISTIPKLHDLFFWGALVGKVEQSRFTDCGPMTFQKLYSFGFSNPTRSGNIKGTYLIEGIRVL